METKDDNKTCDEEMGCDEGAGNSESGKEENPGLQSTGEGNKEGNPVSQPGSVPGQTPFPYGYFQSPNLNPGYYMAQGGFPQGQMPGYWIPPGYGNFQPYMYMQPGPAAPQGTNPANPGQFQQHDAPGDNANGQGAAPGHHKEPGHDELKYGTYVERPGHEAPEGAPETAENVSALSGLTSFLQLDNDTFWKGILVGSLATMLLTSPSVKKGIMKTVIKASGSVKGGIEELKEQLADVEAEVLHDLNKKNK